MISAEADIRTEHVGKMGAPSGRLGHRPPSHSRGGAPPEVRNVECSETEGTVSLNWGQWTMRAAPGLLAVRAEAADEESLRRIQDLLTARLERFGQRRWPCSAGGTGGCPPRPHGYYGYQPPPVTAEQAAAGAVPAAARPADPEP